MSVLVEGGIVIRDVYKSFPFFGSPFIFSFLDLLNCISFWGSSTALISLHIFNSLITSPTGETSRVQVKDLNRVLEYMFPTIFFVNTLEVLVLQS